MSLRKEVLRHGLFYTYLWLVNKNPVIGAESSKTEQI